MIPNYFSDAQMAELERNAEYRQRGSKCPVCLGTGKYRYLGVEYDCPDDDYGHIMLRLAKLYWLHNIPLQYQDLIWDEYPHPVAKDVVERYLANFELLRLSGAGLIFTSKDLGVGKTWGATHVLKERVKQGTDGWFANFFEVKGYYDIVDDAERSYKIRRVQEAELLVLDEVVKPYTEAQKRFYSDKLEELIRPRQNANFPTIITTNMTLDELDDTFPRVFSLIFANGIDIELQGVDARTNGTVWKKTSELKMNGETRPIT